MLPDSLSAGQSFESLGNLENVTVQRQDRTGTQIDEANAPADTSIQVYSQGNIVSHESGPLATLRRTLAQSAGAIHVELAHDRRSNRLPRPMGRCDRRDRFDCQTGNARAALTFWGAHAPSLKRILRNRRHRAF
jgi:hypothetical protein